MVKRGQHGEGAAISAVSCVVRMQGDDSKPARMPLDARQSVVSPAVGSFVSSWPLMTSSDLH